MIAAAQRPSWILTIHSYDWRNRLVTTDGELDFFEKRYFDNLSRMTKLERYNTSESASNLLSREETKYDTRGRVYQRIRYEVTAGSGTVGNKLTDNIWHDCCGNVIKEQPGGSKLFRKFAYDGVARQTYAYVGYDVSESTYAHAENVTGGHSW